MKRHEYRERRITETIGSLVVPPPQVEVQRVLDEYNEEYKKKHNGKGSRGVVAMIPPAGEITILLAPMIVKTDNQGSKPGQGR